PPRGHGAARLSLRPDASPAPAQVGTGRGVERPRSTEGDPRVKPRGSHAPSPVGSTGRRLASTDLLTSSAPYLFRVNGAECMIGSPCTLNVRTCAPAPSPCASRT